MYIPYFLPLLLRSNKIIVKWGIESIHRSPSYQVISKTIVKTPKASRTGHPAGLAFKMSGKAGRCIR